MFEFGEVVVERARGFVPDRPALAEMLQRLALEHPEWFPDQDLDAWEIEIPTPSGRQGYLRHEWPRVLFEALRTAAERRGIES